MVKKTLSYGSSFVGNGSGDRIVIPGQRNYNSNHIIPLIGMIK